MIEVRRIREYQVKNTTRKADKPFDPEILVENIHKLFENPDEIVSKIPEKERFNCFYTLGHAPDNKQGTGRKWKYQEVIPFDIDDCQYNDDELDPKYLEALEKALNVDIKKCVVVATGNGLQILVKPKFIIDDVKWFENNAKYYQALCVKISDTLQSMNLKGTPDPTAFEPNRLFRLPLTENIKANRPKRKAKTLQGNLETLDFDIVTASGLPAVADSDAISEKELSYFKLDHSAIESGCDFLKWAKANQGEVTEPQWYALLSIVGRISPEKAHEYSVKHPGYSKTETDRKIRQALDASGPRTCDNVQSLWGNCKSCPNYKKVNSPIAVRGPNFIATADTGFHLYDPRRRTLTPQYVDLLRFYDQEHPFINVNNSHYQWHGTHWKEVSDKFIDSFAQENFNPPCNNTKASEFKGIVLRTNVKTNDFWENSTKKINLANGILNLSSMILEPHNQAAGFRFCLPYKYDPIAPAPMFEKFLKEITCGDDSLASVLLEYMGYCLAGDFPHAQKILLLLGEGSNGKSTFLNIFAELMGDIKGGVKFLTEKQLSSPHDTVLLDGALASISEEVPPHISHDFWERLKAMATGSKITASKKFKDAYSFHVIAKFILATNNLPKGGDPSTGLFRRFLIVPFNATFSKKLGNIERGIDKKICESELPGILNLALEGYQRLKANHYEFTESAAVNQALEEYKGEADNVTRWAEEHIEPIGLNSSQKDNINTWAKMSDHATVVGVVSEMRSSYSSWAEAQGEMAVGTKNFTHRLKRYLKDKEIPHEFGYAKVGRKTVRVVRGIGAKDDAEF